MKDILKNKKHVKISLITSLILSLFLLILANGLYKRYNSETTKKAVKSSENLGDSIKKIKPKVEYDYSEKKNKISYFNSTPVNMIGIEFNVFDFKKFIGKIKFTDPVSEYKYSNPLLLEMKNPNEFRYYSVSKGIYSHKNNIYSFYLENDEISSELVGSIPYLKEGNARYLIPKIAIVEKNKKYLLESYLLNVTDIKIVDYEFKYMDAENGEEYSVKFSDVGEGEKTEKVISDAPKSGLIRDIIPIESVMELVSKDGEKIKAVYNFSTNLILDLTSYEKLLDSVKGN